MKLNLSFLTGIASLATLLSGAFADSAVTDPVGYITINVAADTSGGSGTLSLVAPSLIRSTDFSGTPSADPSGLSTVTFSSTLPAIATPGAYYAEITTKDHANEGFWATLTAATANSITLSKPVPAGSTGVSIAIRKHQTITSFGGTTNSLNLDPGEDTGSADTIQLLNNGIPGVQYFFGDVALGASAVWYDENGSVLGVDIADPIIPPGQGVIITRRKNTSTSGVLVGSVKTTKTQISVAPGLQILDLNRAVGVDFATSGLDTGNAATGLLRGEDTGGADFMEFIPRLLATDVAYFAAPADTALGIVNQDGESKGTTVVPEGKAVLLTRKAAAGNGTFTINRPTIAP